MTAVELAVMGGVSGCRGILSGRVGLNYTHNITQDHRSLGVIAARG